MQCCIQQKGCFMKIIQHEDWKGRALCPRCKLLFEDIEPDSLICDEIYVHAPIRLVAVHDHPAIICPKCLSPAWIQDPELIPKEYIEKYVNRRCFATMDTYQANQLDNLSHPLTDGRDGMRISEEEWSSFIKKINEYRKQLNLPRAF